MNEYGPLVFVEEDNIWLAALDFAADRIKEVLVVVAGPLDWLFALSLLSFALVELVDGIRGDPLEAWIAFELEQVAPEPTPWCPLLLLLFPIFPPQLVICWWWCWCAITRSFRSRRAAAWLPERPLGDLWFKFWFFCEFEPDLLWYSSPGSNCNNTNIYS